MARMRMLSNLWVCVLGAPLLLALGCSSDEDPVAGTGTGGSAGQSGSGGSAGDISAGGAGMDTGGSSSTGSAAGSAGDGGSGGGVRLPTGGTGGGGSGGSAGSAGSGGGGDCTMPHWRDKAGVCRPFTECGPDESEYYAGDAHADRICLNYDWLLYFGDSLDFPMKAGFDPQGNELVAGWTSNNLDAVPVGSDDAFVRKYDASGNLLWGRQFGTAARDTANGVGSDSAGNVYVLGSSDGALPDTTLLGGVEVTGKTNLFARRYSPNGDLEWSVMFGSPGSDWPQMAVDPTGGAFAVADSRSTVGAEPNHGQRDAVVYSIGADGQLRWVRSAGTSGDETWYSAHADAAGDLYVAGGTNGNFNAIGTGSTMVAKYDAAGNRIYLSQFSSQKRYGSAITADAAGNAYVLSFECNAPSSHFTKLDPNGNVVWSQDLAFGGDEVTLLPSGEILVAGDTTVKFHLQRWRPDGTLIASKVFGRDEAYVTGLDALPGGDVMLYGKDYKSGTPNSSSYLMLMRFNAEQMVTE